MAPEDNRKPVLYPQRLTHQYTTHFHHELPPYASWLTHALLLLQLLHVPFPTPGTPFSTHDPPNAVLSSAQENHHLFPEIPTGPPIRKIQQPIPPPLMFNPPPCLFPAAHSPLSENALLIHFTFVSFILLSVERLLHSGKDLS